MDTWILAFQQNEHSVHIHVTLILSTALQKIQDPSLKVVPFLNLNLPFKKKGPPYQADFVVTKDPTPTINKESTGGPDIVVFKKAIPIISFK